MIALCIVQSNVRGGSLAPTLSNGDFQGGVVPHIGKRSVLFGKAVFPLLTRVLFFVFVFSEAVQFVII